MGQGSVRRAGAKARWATAGRWATRVGGATRLAVVVIVELSEVSDEAPELMCAHGFRSYDAVHAASLAVAGLRDMATLDHGFAALPQTQLTVHTTRARVSTMRRRRARG